MVFSVPGGLTGLIEEANAHQKPSLGQLNFDITQPTIWTLVLGAVFTNFITYGSDQTMIQRYVTASSTKEAKKSMWIDRTRTRLNSSHSCASRMPSSA